MEPQIRQTADMGLEILVFKKSVHRLVKKWLEGSECFKLANNCALWSAFLLLVLYQNYVQTNENPFQIIAIHSSKNESDIGRIILKMI
jgi:hypothetical protein